MTTTGFGICRWCGKPYLPRAGGSEQRFCAPGCRQRYHAATRAWSEKALELGILQITDLKTGRPRSVHDDLAAFILEASGKLDALLGHLHDDLSEYEQKVLPPEVWGLVWGVYDFICDAEDRAKAAVARCQMAVTHGHPSMPDLTGAGSE